MSPKDSTESEWSRGADGRWHPPDDGRDYGFSNQPSRELLDEDALASNTNSYRAGMRWIGIGGVFLIAATSVAVVSSKVVAGLMTILAVVSFSIAAVDLRRARRQTES